MPCAEAMLFALRQRPGPRQAPFRSGLATGAPVGEAGQLALCANPDPGSAAGAGEAAATVDGFPFVAGKAPGATPRLQVGEHGLACEGEEGAELLVAQIGGRLPGVDALMPQRLAAVDVADPRRGALVEQQRADRLRTHRAGAPDHLWQVPALFEDVRPEVAEPGLLVSYQLDH